MGKASRTKRGRLPHRRWLPLPAQKADRLGLSNNVGDIRGWPPVVAGRRVRSQVTHCQRANGDAPTLAVGSSRALGLLAARRSRDRLGDCRRRIGTPFAGPAASTLARRTCEVVSSPGADIGARSRVARRPGPGGRGRAMAGGTACRIGHGPLDEPKAGRALGLDLGPIPTSLGDSPDRPRRVALRQAPDFVHA